MATGAAPRGARGGDAWHRHGWLLPASTAALLVVATGVSLAEVEASRRLTVVTLAAAFGAWQWAWRPWRRLDTRRVAAVIWGLGTIGLWSWLAWTDATFHLLLFVVCMLLFFATELRVGAGLAAALGVAVALVNLPPAPTPAEAAVVAVVVVATSTLATVIGAWIHGIIAQSHERADLIAQLDATRADLADAERAAGAQAERLRLAAEIHDTLAQGFTSIVLLLDAVRTQVQRGRLRSGGGPDDEVVPRLDRAIETARSNLAEARHLVAGLGPVALVDASLPDAVERRARQLAESSGMALHVDVQGEARPLPTEREVALLRVAQESLTNVARHAGASSVTVALRYGAEGGVALEVSDDGCGFDPARTVDGHGLRGMAGRLAALGGGVAVTSDVDSGTRVEAHLP